MFVQPLMTLLYLLTLLLSMLLSGLTLPSGGKEASKPHSESKGKDTSVYGDARGTRIAEDTEVKSLDSSPKL